MTTILRRDLFSTPWGWVGALYSAKGLRRLVLPRAHRKEAEERLELLPGTGATDKAWPELRKQVREYLSGRRRSFHLPLDPPPAGPFTEKVRQAAAAIPYGETATYGELAARAGSPGAARAVGRVMNRNPLPPVIPCHRVVAAKGLGGFASGPEMKKKMLDLEKKSGKL
jgi:methylated-DNA-[protein]-cysteine S-methyltransferase